MKRGVLPLYVLIGFSFFATLLLLASDNPTITGLQAANQPPYSLATSVETDGKTAVVDLTTLFMDADGDTLAFNTDDPAVTIDGTTLSFTAPLDASENYMVTLTVSDGVNTIAKPLVFTHILPSADEFDLPAENTPAETVESMPPEPADTAPLEPIENPSFETVENTTSEPPDLLPPEESTIESILPESAIIIPAQGNENQTISADSPFRGTVLIPVPPSAQQSSSNGTGISAFPCAPAPPGLIAWWPADGDATDQTGNGHDGTLNNVTFTAGQVAQAFEFGGNHSDNVSVPHDVALNPGAMTVLGWVRLDTGSIVQGRPYQKTDSAEDGYFTRLGPGAGTFSVFYGNGSGGFVRDPVTGIGGILSNSGTLILGSWNFFASTLDSTDGARLDFNGLLSTAFDNNNSAITTYTTATNPFVIGSAINGRMDEIRIFDNALTPAQINVLYQADLNGVGICRDVCGDGFLEPTEQCDDGNTANNDGCTSTCQFEDGFCFSVEWNGTTVVLDTDITNATGNCINVNNGDVTIDCNGHTIVGDGTGYGVGTGSFNDIIVRNCHFVNFTTGIFFSGGVNSNVHAINNTIDGALALDGLLDDGGDLRQYIGNTFNVTGTAISANSLPSTSVNATYNNITAFDGITATDMDDSLIAHNNITSIGDYGISLQNGAENNTLRNNSIIGGGVAGLSIAGAQIVDSFFTETYRGGVWYSWGKRHYSMFPETHEVDVSLPDDDGEYKVRLRHNSTWIDAAHMDSLFLRVNGTLVAPTTAIDLNTSENILYKLNATDLDVADVFKHTVEATWEGIDSEGTYAVVMHGREEAAETTRTPLYSPLGARFGEYHNYTLTDNGASVVDGSITTEDGYGLPDFITHWETATGHPEADNVWYLKSDSNNLYVGFEFTSDNTDDYGKDWAAVFVGTGVNKKTFNVSLNQTQYGNSSWSYTQTVNYQHKVFEFAIPLSEIDAEQGGTLAISFAAYGTGGGPVPSTGNSVINTSVSHTGRGIEVEDSTDNTFINTNITNITDTALNVLDGAHRNNFTNTTIVDSTTGITIRNSDNGVYINTRLQNITLEGVTFENSLTNTFTNLNLSANDTWLIIDAASTGNTFTGAKFENTTAGSITLFPALTLPAGAIVNQTNFHIQNNSAFINTTNLSTFNVSGRVALAGITLTDPRPRVDFEDDGTFANCAGVICFVESYAGDVFTFNVSHFTTYQVSNDTFTNTSPNVTTPDIAPDPASGNDALNASCVFTDDDLDLGTLSFNWTVNAVLVNSTNYSVSNGTNVTNFLYPGSYGLDDNVTVFCSAFDAQNAFSPVTNDSIIITLNAHPSLGQVILNSTDGSGFLNNVAATTENLTAFIFNAFDADNDSVHNITDWRVNGTSIALLNMPFETNSSNVSIGAIRDYSTFARNGTLGNGSLGAVPSWNASGQVGGAYTFDGTDDFIEVQNPAQFATNITVEAWILRTAAFTDGAGVTFGKEPDAPANYGWLLHPDAAGSIRFIVSNGTGAGDSGTSMVLGADLWHHVVGTYNGSNVSIYVNGTLSSSGSFDGGPLNNPAGAAIHIGKDARYNNRFFTGSLDEIRVYNRSLSPGQIYQLYLDGNNSNHSRTWVTNETAVGDVWSVAVTPNDGRNASDGTTVLSNNVTISANNEPQIAQAVLNSSDGSGESGIAGASENLTVHIVGATDDNNDSIQNITDWRLDGSSIMLINMPFESNISDTSAGRIRSYTTNSVNGTLGNGIAGQAPAWTEAGQIGGAYEFDGTDDQIIVDFNAPVGPYSITAWVRHNGTPSGFEVIMEFGDDSPFFGGDGGSLALYPILSGGTIPPDQWIFVAFTYDGTDSTLYINDTVVDSATASPPDTGVELGIGYHGTDTPWTGAIDEVRIFNRSLSQEQITQLFEEGLLGLHMTNLTSNETTLGDVWTVAATPNDQHPNTDGLTVISNTVTISDNVTCPVQVGTDTTLTQDITCPETAINITANNVDFNCDGFTVTYGTAGTNSVSGVNATGFTNVTVRNCIIVHGNVSGNLTRGIGYTSVTTGTILNNSLAIIGESNNNAVRLETSSSNQITNNSILLNVSADDNSGIVVSDTSNTNAYLNAITTTGAGTASGLSIDTASTNTQFANTTITSESGGGVVFQNAINTRFFNTTINATQLGISISGGSDGNRFNTTIIETQDTWVDTGPTGGSFNNQFNDTTFINTSAGSIRIPGTAAPGDSFTIDQTLLAVTFNRTFLNSTFLDFFNQSGIITLNGLPFTNPQPLVDFDDDGTFATCSPPQCTEVSFLGGVFVFNVSSFTTYAASETPVNLTCPFNMTTSTTLAANLTCPHTAINFRANNSYLDCNGFTVTYGTAGTNNAVGVNGTNLINATIRNCILRDTNQLGVGNTGINLTNANDSTIVNTSIQTNGTSTAPAIQINNATRLTIANNTLRTNSSPFGASRGIRLVGRILDSQFTGNIITLSGSSGNNEGLRLESSIFGPLNLTIQNNTIVTGFGGTINHGLTLLSTSNATIRDNYIQARGSLDSHGIHIEGGNSQNNTIVNNTVSTVTAPGAATGLVGIELFLGPIGNLVFNNTISTNGSTGSHGIHVIVSTAVNTIANNTVITNASDSHAIRIAGGNNNLAENNTVASLGTSGNGFSIGSEDNSNFNNNTIWTATQGFALDSATNNNLTGNLISGTTAEALFLLDSTPNHFNNTILNDTASWINSSGASDNNITNTTFQTPSGSIRVNGTAVLNGVFDITRDTLNISSNLSFLNSTTLAPLNQSAQITLNGLSFTDPQTLVDFEDDGSFVACSPPDCDEVSYTGGAFVFNVSHFTSHAASETSNASSCPVDIATTTALASNVGCPATAINIVDGNLTLDCAGYNITYANASTGFGVNISGFSNVTVRNCNIVQNNASNGGSGIVSTSASNNSLLNNNVSVSNLFASGIIISTGNGHTVSGNNVTGNGTGLIDGITLNSATNSTVANNTALIPGNSSGTNGAISIVLGHNNTLINNTGVANNSPGIAIITSRNNTLFNNSAFSSDSQGLLVFSTTAPPLFNNLINNTGASTTSNGFAMQSPGSANTITGAIGHSVSGIGLWLRSSSNNLSNSSGTSITNVGLRIDGTANIVENSTGSGTNGIDVRAVDNVIVRNSNGTSTSGSGITLAQGSDRNTLFNVIGTATSGFGINFDTNSVENNITNSTFLSNTGQAIRLAGASVVNNSFVNNTLRTNATWIAFFANPSENHFENTLFDSQNGSILIIPRVTPSVLSFLQNINTALLNTSLNRSFLNSTNLTELNTTAQITLRGTTFADPQALVDFEDDGTFAVCSPPQCTEISYAGDTFVFNVSSFTSYASAETIALGVINITFDKTDTPDPVIRGTTLNYTIEINNTGNATAENLTIVETYPAGVSFVTSSPLPSSGNNTFAIGNLTNGSTTTINITVTVGSNVVNGTLLNNTINLSFQNGSGSTTSANDSELTTVLGIATLTVVKTDSPDPVNNGSTLSYTITITNTGDEIAYNITAFEGYPANVTLLTTAPTPSAGNDTFAIGNLTPGASTTINITVNVSANMTSGILNNTVNVTFVNATGASDTLAAFQQTTVTVPGVPAASSGGGGGGSGSVGFRTANITREQPTQALPVVWPTVAPTTAPPAAPQAPEPEQTRETAQTLETEHTTETTAEQEQQPSSLPVNETTSPALIGLALLVTLGVLLVLALARKPNTAQARPKTREETRYAQKEEKTQERTREKRTRLLPIPLLRAPKRGVSEDITKLNSELLEVNKLLREFDRKYKR